MSKSTEVKTGIDWDWVVRDMKAADWEKNYAGGWERTVFLGTVFALYPSGKFYTCFANSNVDPCPSCRGQGTVENKHFKRKRYEQLDRKISRMRTNALQQFGYYCEGKWPESLQEKLVNLQEQLYRYAPKQQCNHCHGVGSREAYLDECYTELLEKEAEELGYFITSGEGDPCDIFAGECSDDMPEEVALKIIEGLAPETCRELLGAADQLGRLASKDFNQALLDAFTEGDVSGADLEEYE